MRMSASSGRHHRVDNPVDAFEAAWKSVDAQAVPPALADYLPDTSDIRRSALVELIRVDLQQRWLRAGTGAGVGKRLADYCAEFPDLPRAALPATLVYEEFVIRRQAGHRVDPRTYLTEFPEQAAELRRLLITESETTTVAQSALLDDTDELVAEESTQRAGPNLLDDTRHAATERAHPYLSDHPQRADDTQLSDPDFTGFAPADLDATAAADFDVTAAAVTSATGLHRDTAPMSAPSTAALDDIEVGQQVDDFDLLNGLGSGAFARVFLARQRSMQRLVAVKISENHGSEPQTLAQLDHDYIVRVFDQRTLPHRDLRLLYMQYLPGGTLLDVLRRMRSMPETRSGELLLDAVDAAMEAKGEIRPTDSSVRTHLATLSWPETVAWLGRRLADALDYAGKRGVLHRDVKPANVLLTAEGIPKLADFNISFARNVAGTSPVAYFGGSLSYMSPEQLEACHPGKPTTAADLDTRADVFSLGVVLFELLTGRKPFDDTDIEGGDATTLDNMLRRRRDGVTGLAALPPDTPAALRRILLSCLSPDPNDRPRTAAQLAQQLDLCLDPHARDLVDPPPDSWRLRLRRYTVPVMVAAVAGPNALAALYNIHHNRMLIIDQLQPAAQDRFNILTPAINGVLWPIGLALIVYFARNVLAVPKGLRQGKTYDTATLAQTREDTLLLGVRTVAVVFGMWFMAALAFPISLRIAAGEIPQSAYVHFFSSIVVCGAIAVAYPFFLVTFYAVRCIYPMLLQYGSTTPTDARQLRHLDRRANIYLAIAAAIPLIGVAGVTFIQTEELPEVIGAVRVLCVGGIVAFALTYWVFRMLEADLRALERVVSYGKAG